MWDDNPAVVLDNGSGVLKGGYAGEEQPRSVFASLIAKGRGANQGSILIGDAAQQCPKGYTLSYPIEHGTVSDWDGVERLWRQMYQELGADATQHATLVTEAPLNPKANREKVAEVLFERFQAPALQLQIQAVLTLYSSGRTDGLVFDSGDGVSHIVPVFDGHTVPSSIRRMDIAGRHLTEWMMTLLSDETDRPFTTTADRELARFVKEKSCYVAQDFDAELTRLEAEGPNGPATERIELPDGTHISIARSRFGCPELLFSPSLADKSGSSVQELLVESVNTCPVDIRRPLLGNIVLAGGSTMIKGLETRIAHEVKQLINARARDDVRVIAPGERKYSVWMGAAILASLASFASEWITRQDYDEHGCGIVHSRCNALDFASR